MTLAEFARAHPREAQELSWFTGHWVHPPYSALNAERRFDVTGVYDDIMPDGQVTYLAHVDHVVSDHIDTEICQWFGSYAHPDRPESAPGAWRWLGPNGRPCDAQGREEP